MASMVLVFQHPRTKWLIELKKRWILVQHHDEHCKIVLRYMALKKKIDFNYFLTPEALTFSI